MNESLPVADISLLRLTQALGRPPKEATDEDVRAALDRVIGRAQDYQRLKSVIEQRGVTESADTGAREPQDSAAIERDVVAVRGYIDYPERFPYVATLEALDRLAALAHLARAAGVDAPPDEESGSAAESAARAYWRSFLADTAIALRAQNVSREQVAGAIEHALDADAKLASLAGVGEACPDEPDELERLRTENENLRKRIQRDDDAAAMQAPFSTTIALLWRRWRKGSW